MRDWKSEWPIGRGYIHIMGRVISSEHLSRHAYIFDVQLHTHWVSEEEASEIAVGFSLGWVCGDEEHSFDRFEGPL